MIYLDTSVLVSALTSETATLRAQDVLRRGNVDTLCVSHWSITEFSSAISVKERTGQVTALESGRAREIFSGMLETSLEVLGVSGLHFRTAATFSADATLGLRSGDALHLAIAAGYDARVVTLDKRLAKAGLLLGFTIELA